MSEPPLGSLEHASAVCECEFGGVVGAAIDNENLGFDPGLGDTFVAPSDEIYDSEFFV